MATLTPAQYVRCVAAERGWSLHEAAVWGLLTGRLNPEEVKEAVEWRP